MSIKSVMFEENDFSITDYKARLQELYDLISVTEDPELRVAYEYERELTLDRMMSYN